jgi:serine/threonine-protein kinase RsbT
MRHEIPGQRASQTAEFATLVPFRAVRSVRPADADERAEAPAARAADAVVAACRTSAEALAAVRSHCSIEVSSSCDIVTARNAGREMAEWIGFSATDQTLIATVISELARNQLLYAHGGTIALEVVASESRRGLVMTAQDEGPGIPVVEDALREGFSTSGGLGLGLPGARRMMDALDITTGAGRGTRVVVKKWLR